MPFPWQEYTRTCAECGYTWQVPRWAKRRRTGMLRILSRVSITTNTGETTDSTDLNRQVASISAQNEQIEAFRHCPECGAAHFTSGTSRVKRKS